MKRKLISTVQLAKICGVSQGTVDRALNGRPGINPETKARVLAVAREYGYPPALPETNGKTKSAKLIGIVVFNLENPYFSHIVTKIEEYCAVRGYSTVVMFTHTDPKREIECVENLYYMNVDGIVICPVNCGEVFENYLLSLDVPICSIGNRTEQIKFIGFDNGEAIRKNVEYVLSKGYDHLIYVKPDAQFSDLSLAQLERLEAFRRLSEEYGFSFDEIYEKDAKKSIRRDKKSVFFCSTDITAIRLFPLAEKEKVGIIGFDNVWLIDLFRLKLDSLSYDIDLTARSVVEYLLESKQDTPKVECSIVRRGSV